LGAPVDGCSDLEMQHLVAGRGALVRAPQKSMTMKGGTRRAKRL